VTRAPDLTALRTVLLTDGRGDGERIVAIARAAVAGGIRAIQLREFEMTARQIAALCAPLRDLLAPVHGLLIVNDRADVVAAGLADGVHLGHRSLGPAEVREFLPAGALLGCSCHDAEELRAACLVDYVVLAPVFATNSKPGATPLGIEPAAQLVLSSPRPVVLLGGITPANVRQARQIGAYGVAAMGGVCDATDPQAVVAALVASAPADPAK